MSCVASMFYMFFLFVCFKTNCLLFETVCVGILAWTPWASIGPPFTNKGLDKQPQQQQKPNVLPHVAQIQ